MSPDNIEPVPWPVFPTVDDIVFHGVAPETGGALVTVETSGGEVLGLLPHHVRHSPDGFQWGYGGSGAAETARCLLLAALPDPSCQKCRGTRKVCMDGDGTRQRPLVERPFDPETDDPDSDLVLACHWCDDGLASVPYQDFKFEIVAGWEREWRMSRAEIRSWLDQHARTGS